MKFLFLLCLVACIREPDPRVKSNARVGGSSIIYRVEDPGYGVVCYGNRNDWSALACVRVTDPPRPDVINPPLPFEKP